MNLMGLRQLPAPTPMRDAMRVFAKLAQHDPALGVDPAREAVRARMLAGGPVQISSIASAAEPLPIGRVALDPRRRQWRFRAREASTNRVLFEEIVEGENPEAAEHAGKKKLMRHWKKYGHPDGARVDGAIIGTVVAI